MKKLSLTSILESLDYDTNLSVGDILKHGYSRKIMRVICYIKQMEERGQLEKYRLKSSIPFAHGQAGAIFDSLDDGYVIKASLDEHDLEQARKLKGLNHPHIAKIKSIKVIKIPEEKPSQAKEKKLALIQVEKLKSFDSLSDFVNDLMYPLIDELNVKAHRNQDIFQEKLSKEMMRRVRDKYKSEKGNMSPEERKICRGFLRLMKDLHKTGYHFQDRQSSQFLMNKNGAIKLVDFGSTRKNAE